MSLRSSFQLFGLAGLVGLVTASTTSSALAQDVDSPTAPATLQRIAELERRLALLADELESAQLGESRPALGDGVHGFAPGASRVYEQGRGVSIGGYGELRYEDRMGGTAFADLHRAVLYFGYRFDDHFLFNSEFEFEHATVEDHNDGGPDTAPGSVSVEFAYVEYQSDGSFGLRGGLLLVPMGIVNEQHEPNTFYSADRPFVEQRILPSTWRENGFGAFGSCDCGLTWRAYVINGLDSEGFDSNGIRGGRQKGGRAKAEDLAFVARVDQVVAPGFTVGASGYTGRSGQNNSFGADTTILEAHAEYSAGGFRARGLFAHSRIGDAAAVNADNGLAGAASIGSEQQGWFVELGYDVLHGNDQSLIPFVRFEDLDTQVEVPVGFAKNPARDREYTTFGVSYSPIRNVVLKADYTDGKNGAGTEDDLFRLTLGWVL